MGLNGEQGFCGSIPCKTKEALFVSTTQTRSAVEIWDACFAAGSQNSSGGWARIRSCVNPCMTSSSNPLASKSWVVWRVAKTFRLQIADQLATVLRDYRKGMRKWDMLTSWPWYRNGRGSANKHCATAQPVRKGVTAVFKSNQTSMAKKTGRLIVPDTKKYGMLQQRTLRNYRSHVFEASKGSAQDKRNSLSKRRERSLLQAASGKKAVMSVKKQDRDEGEERNKKVCVERKALIWKGHYTRRVSPNKRCMGQVHASFFERYTSFSYLTEKILCLRTTLCIIRFTKMLENFVKYFIFLVFFFLIFELFVCMSMCKMIIPLVKNSESLIASISY